jgi:hypothetical protein
MSKETFTTLNTLEPQIKQVEKKPIFGYKCRPRKQCRSPFSRLGGI